MGWANWSINHSDLLSPMLINKLDLTLCIIYKKYQNLFSLLMACLTTLYETPKTFTMHKHAYIPFCI